MRTAMRIFGALNVIVCILSFFYSAWLISIHWGRWPGNPNYREWAVFFAIKTLSVFLVGFVGYFGVRLIFCVSKALRQTVLTFVFQLIFWLIHFYATWGMFAVRTVRGEIRIGLWGIAIAEVDVTVLSGYALLGIIAATTLTLIERRNSGTSRLFPTES